VTKVDGKRIEFTVSAHDGMQEIGNGTHRRTAIDLRSFNESIASNNKG
jgi:fluoroacetyl-CoA thioesterase